MLVLIKIYLPSKYNRHHLQKINIHKIQCAFKEGSNIEEVLALEPQLVIMNGMDHPVEQGLWGAVEVFLDTVLVCLVSALTVVLSGLWNTGLDGAVLTMAAFEKMLPGKIGSYICLGAIILFGFSCLISFYTYAERAAVYVFGTKSRFWIKLIWVGMIFIGSQTTLGFAWDLADTINGLMIIPNLVGLLLLSGQVVKLKKEYFGNRLPNRKHK